MAPCGRRHHRHCTWPPPLPSWLCDEFAHSIALGQLRQVQSLLASQPRLANARFSPDHITPLMLASTSDTSVAPAMIGCLLSFRASLATRNSDRCHVLLYACKHGASSAIIDCLLAHGTKRSSAVFRWSHCNIFGEGAIVLAARSGNAQLCCHLLDIVPHWGALRSNCSLKVLEAAIMSQSEELVLKLLRHQAFDELVDYALIPSDDSDSDGVSGKGHFISVDICVRHALLSGMWNVVQGLEPLAPGSVREVCWLFLYARNFSLSIESLQAIAERHRRDCLWQERRVFVLLRTRGLAPSAPVALASHPLVRLPWDLLMYIMEFCYAWSPVGHAEFLYQQRYFRKKILS